MKTELKWGLLLFSGALLLRCLTDTPHFLLGVMMGLSIFLEILSALPAHTVQKIKAKKKAWFKLT